MSHAPSDGVVAVSERFFLAVVLPAMERCFPAETAAAAFGVFGLGSEAYGLDDRFSHDHHWGLRVDALLPRELPVERRGEIAAALADALPESFEGHPLRRGHLAGAGVAFDTLEGLLRRSIGLERLPETDAEWLAAPEEDFHHVINGVVWHDPSGRFTRVRQALAAYYPETVWRRRIAHWCRYFSGMGCYALRRALLRGNEYYAFQAFSKALRWGIQLAFLLDRTYFPYDKWLPAYFARLPRLHAPLAPLVEEALRLETGWERRMELLEAMADVLDRAMVSDGLIRPHPRFRGSETSGYRLLEHAYAELIHGLPPEIRTIVPVWDQVYLEEFHAGYVATLSMEEWDRLLCLRPEGE